MMTKYDIDIEKIKKETIDRGYSVITPPDFIDLTKSARAEYFKLKTEVNISSGKEHFDYKDIKECPKRKLSISSKNSLGESYAQFLQTTFLDCRTSKYNSLNEIFILMLSLRNILMGTGIDFGFNPLTDRFWNASRIHDYPRGGGFMATHHDTYFDVELEKLDIPYYQILVPLSEKGVDYFDGGGILIDKNNNKINTDHEFGMGSIVIFDGKIDHGVEDIDPGEIVDFDSLDGRVALFANVYKVY
jgi:hypothetical protein